MLNYYTSRNSLMKSCSRMICTVLFALITLSFATAQDTCPDPGGGVNDAGLDYTTANTTTLYPQSVPTGQSGEDRSTVGRLVNTRAVTTVFPSNIITINPTLTNGHTGSVVLFFRNLWFGNAPNAELRIFQGTSISGTPLATINAADSTTYTQTSVSYTGPVTLQFRSPVAGTSGNFDIHVRYWTGDQIFQSGFGRQAAVWTDFIQPDSYTFVDDQRTTVPNAPYSLNTNPISIAHFDAQKNFVSAELAFCANSPLHNIGFGFNGGDYPGKTMFTKRISYTVDRDGAVNPSSNPLKIARLVWLMANRTSVPVGSLRGTNDEVWSIVNSTNSTGGGSETAVPSLPTPNEPTFSITSETSAPAGGASSFTVNFNMAGSFAKRLKLIVPAGVTINSVTGTGVTYSGGFINFATLPGTATIQAVSATPRTADLRVVYDETGFYNTTNMSLFVSCRGADVQTFLGLSQGQETHPYREASATWLSTDFDYGDLPNSYATTSASNGPSHAITGYNATTHTATLMLGSQIDSETDGVAGTVATGDDLAGIDDEDAITKFPVLVPGSTSYSVILPVTNTTGATATVKGWIDFNKDGVFGTGEDAIQTVSNGGTSVTLTWSGFPAVANFGYLYARFRIASLASEIAAPTGPANSGEVEDYRLFISRTVAGSVFNDLNRNTRIDSGEPFTSLPAPMYVYMVQNNIIVDAATVAANGSYLLLAPAGQTSNLHLSTVQYAIGTDISVTLIDHTPVTGWTTTGENGSGTNTGSGDFNPDGILQVTVTTANLTNRNFGITYKTAGTSKATDICANERSVMSLADFIDGEDAGGTWSYVSGSGITFDALAGTIQLTSSATTSTYRYDIPATGTTPASFSIATVNVRPVPVKYQSITICQGASLCITNPAGTARVIAPQETICHTATGVYSDTLTGAGRFGCDSIVVTTLTVVPTANAGTDGNVTSCNNSTTPIDLFSLITGEQTGGVWQRLTGTGGTFNAVSGTFTPAIGATSSTFSYTVTSAGSCGSDMSVATVNLNNCAVAISGNVWNDGNGNAVKNASELPVSGNNTNNGGTSVAAGGNIYANLVNGSNQVVQSVQVNADGSYNFTGVTGALPYKVVLTTTPQTVNSVLTTGTGPSGWLPTGTSLGGTASIGNTSYIINLGTVSADVNNADFGIQRPPVADPKAYSVPNSAYSTTPPVGYPAESGYMSIKASSSALTGYPTNGSLSGSDAEDCASTGTCNTGTSTTFNIQTVNANTILYYDFGGVLGVVKIDQSSGIVAIPNFDVNKLVIYGEEGSGTSSDPIGFTYSITDKAGATSAPVIYKIATQVPLPVTLISFTASREGQSVNLVWATSDESHSSYFEVQHSQDGKNWMSLGQVKALGESIVKHNYDFTHATASVGLNYYRLKMVDTDDMFAYSSIRSLKIDGIAQKMFAYPNPVSDGKLLINLSGTESYKAEVFSVSGVKVLDQNLGTGRELNVSGLKSGMYVLNIKSASGVVSTSTFVVK